MENFVNLITREELYPNILLYQCVPTIGEKIERFREKDKLINTHIIGLFGKRYNHLLIDKLGVEGFLEMINNITLLEGGKISKEWIVKKSWMSEPYRMKLYNYIH